MFEMRTCTLTPVTSSRPSRDEVDSPNANDSERTSLEHVTDSSGVTEEVENEESKVYISIVLSDARTVLDLGDSHTKYATTYVNAYALSVLEDALDHDL
jgi:hypothetical protein